MSPAAQFLFFLVAAVLAAIPVLFASKTPRFAGSILLTIALALTYQSYAGFDKEQQDYRKRAKAHSISLHEQQQSKNEPAVSGN
jgi:hypothetical protein